MMRMIAMPIFAWALVLAPAAIAQITSVPQAGEMGMPAGKLPPPPTRAELAAQLAEVTTQIGTLQQQLVTANAEIARLRTVEAEQVNTKAALEIAIAKNARLVRAGTELLASYERRYGRGLPDPLQWGRRAFEEEAQAFGDRLYDNRYDVPLAAQVAAEEAARAAAQNETNAPETGQAVPSGDASTNDSGSGATETN